MSGQNWLRKRTIVYNPVPKLPEPPSRFRFFRILWTALKRTCTGIGAVVLFCIILGVWSASQVARPVAPKLPDQVILSFSLGGNLPESPGVAQYLSRLGLGENIMTLRDMVDAIDAAASDSKVKAITFYLTSTGYELTQLQEIRAAVLRFRASGKPSFVYASSYGEGGTGLGMYYLASAFDQIWMQPVGVVSIGGISAEVPFFRKVMDEYGVRPEFFQRKEYKTAMEHLTSSEMSEPSKRMMTELIGDMGDQVVEEVVRDRKKVSGNFRSLMDLGLITDQPALKAGLVDRVDYEDVFVSEIENKIVKGAKEVPVDQYWTAQSLTKLEQKILSPDKKLPTVALIYIEGVIEDDSGSETPYDMGEGVAGAKQIADIIRQAAEEDDVRSIIIRINSPGGSPTASETIYRSIVWAQQVKKKTIWVSMGASAASGGYWIASPAQKIYALGSTLTGSIGVVGGKVDASGLMQKFNVTWDGVSYGENAGMWSFTKPFSPVAQQQFEASLDNVYGHFISHVASGRKMSPQKVEEVAKGRVWTGRQAKKVGLVDAIGGLDVVLDDISRTYGGKDRHDLTIISLQKKNSPMDVFYALLEQSSVKQTPLGIALRKAISFLSPMMLEINSPRLVYEPTKIRL